MKNVFKSSKYVRAVGLLVMVVLMLGFVNNMAHVYINSLNCMVGSADVCATSTTIENSQNMQVVDASPVADEWLCSTGEKAYCAPLAPNSVEIAELSTR